MRPRETTDPWGRRVLLTLERWMHVLDEHPEMVELIDEAIGVP
jgi:hypothetical protein